jgi:Cft2 family RNA processing exonuclease
MPKEIYPSSYLCDCGYQSDFCENTVTEMKQASMRRQQRLGSDDGKHVVVFNGGEMTAVWCPKLCKDIPANKPSQRIARPPRVRKR